jgi:hypothetical protein
MMPMVAMMPVPVPAMTVLPLVNFDRVANCLHTGLRCGWKAIEDERQQDECEQLFHRIKVLYCIKN